LGGRNITSWPAHKRARVGIGRTFQVSSEFKRLTVLENLVCGPTLPRGETLLGAVLGQRWRGVFLAGSLSGGERRLVEIGRAPMGEPRLLLLDEPLAGVRPGNVSRILGALRSLRESGVTIVTCLHEPDAVERVRSHYLRD
jgi:ABC-type branched-subunit amino acid transport system ATPase component